MADSAVSLQPDLSQLPVHVGIIMDGNGRWAKLRNNPRSMGHYAGLETAKRIAAAAADLGLKYLTLYIFSTENWKRTEQEVGYLMGLIRNHLRSEFEFYKSHHIRIEHIGNLSGLPVDIQADIQKAKEETASFTGLTLVLAINYGGRDEIVRGVQKLIKSGASAESITEESFSKSFDIPSLPDMDLLIRTGGEERISNFLLWHSAYAELLFTDTLWPDYTKEELYSDIALFQKRTRRFGAVPV
jgi:undecaprenyl diphosphate synthase